MLFSPTLYILISIILICLLSYYLFGTSTWDLIKYSMFAFAVSYISVWFYDNKVYKYYNSYDYNYY